VAFRDGTTIDPILGTVSMLRLGGLTGGNQLAGGHR